MPKRKNAEEPVINKKVSPNTKIYNTLTEYANINEVEYFDKLSYVDQCKIIDDLTMLNNLSEISTPYRIQLLKKKISIQFKLVALKKINIFEKMDHLDGEYNKLKKWIECFLSIPFDCPKKIPISIEDGYEKCQLYMERCKEILNDSVYGINDAKMQIMQIVGQWISNPKSMGNAIGLKGPMGTGKTTLIKNGVSKMLERDFAFITLGGANDGSFLEGHSYTYEGSSYGKIVDILIQCKSNNPIIFFDELDKVSESSKGDEIIGILTHLIDSTQNNEFHDKYFSEINFNLSNCLFIFSYNDESKINPILKDRMYTIETKGYSVKDKIIIAKNFIIPSIEKEMCLKTGDVVLSETAIQYIIEKFTNPEQGVRNLKRNIEIIYSKINLYRFLKPNTTLFDNKIIDIKFPYVLTDTIINDLLPKIIETNTFLHMYS